MIIPETLEPIQYALEGIYSIGVALFFLGCIVLGAILGQTLWRWFR